MTAMTPPPQPFTTPTAPAPKPPQPAAAKWISIIAIIVGSLVLGSTLVGGVMQVTRSALAGSDETRTLDVTGIRSLDLSTGASDMTVQFGDVDEAVLDLEDASGEWVFRRDGDELEVSTPQDSFSFGFWFGGNGTAVLTLPRELEGIDASMELSAGSLVAEGDFGELDLEMSAGRMEASGSATSVSATVSAGNADLRLADVRSADLELSAGGLDAQLTGRAPREVSIDVSAGTLELELPQATYDVASEVSAGDLDNRLEQGTRAGGRIDVTISAGTVTLRN